MAQWIWTQTLDLGITGLSPVMVGVQFYSYTSLYGYGCPDL